MENEAIILAGGFGTRLKGIIDDKPKPMAPVNGKPFLEYLLSYLDNQGITHTILSVGYKSETISGYFGTKFKSISIDYAYEPEPLGTGGGIMNAIKYSKSDHIIILNGDTLFNIDIKKLHNLHQSKRSELTVALRKMEDGSRYGSVNIDDDNCIKAFTEKKEGSNNILINGGVYLLNKSTFLEQSFPARFSFEKEFLEAGYINGHFYGMEFNDYFIDIGIPETYSQAQADFLNKF